MPRAVLLADDFSEAKGCFLWGVRALRGMNMSLLGVNFDALQALKKSKKTSLAHVL